LESHIISMVWTDPENAKRPCELTVTSRVSVRRPVVIPESLLPQPRPPRACSDNSAAKLPPAGWRARRTAAHYPIGHRAYVPNRPSRLCTLCFCYFVFIYYYYLYWFFHTHKHIHTPHAITRARTLHTYPSSLPNVFSSFFLHSFTDYN